MARRHRRTVKKDLHDPDNHDGVITDLEPDILEREVKWASGSITTSKASGDNEIPFCFYILISCKDGHNKGQKWYGPNRSRKY